MDVATLGIKVEIVGGEKVTSDLANIGVVGEASAKKTAEAMARSADAARRYQESIERQSQSLRQAADTSFSFAEQQRRWIAELPQATAGQNQVAAATRLTAAELANAEKKYDELIAAQEREVAVAKQVTDSTQAIGRKHVEAIAIDEARTAALNKTTSAFDLSNAGLGRVRQGLTSFVAQATGTIPVLDRIGTSLLGGFGVQGAVIVGVLAGVAAISYAWRALESDAAKLADKVSESMKKIREESKAAQLATGDLQVEQARKNLKDAQDALNRSQQGTSRYNATLGGYSNDGPVSAAQVALAKENLIKAQNDLDLFTAKKAETDRQSLLESRQADAEALALRIQFGNATKDELKKANDEYAKYVAEASRLAKTQTDNVLRDADLRNAQILSSALSPKSSIVTHGGIVDTPEQQKLIDGLDKQLDEMRKVAAASADAIRIGQQEAELAKVQGFAHAYLTIQYKAENDAVVARRTLFGDALTVQMASIESTRKQSEVTLYQTTTTEDAAAAMKYLNEQTKVVSKTGADNEKAVREQADQYANLAKIIGTDVLHAVSQFTSGGTISWSSFFKAAESGSSHMLQQLSSDVDAMQKKRDDALKAEAAAQTEADKQHAAREAAKYAEDLSRYASYLKAAQGIGAALSGASIGYGIGQSTGNSTTGALGGAASGALAGNAILPGWGAVIGGLAGAAGGLLGAASAQAAAAAQLRQAALAFGQTVDSYVLGASGDSTAQQLAAAKATYTDLYLQADQLMEHGGLTMKEFAARVGQLNTAYQQIVDSINAAVAAEAKRANDNLRIRLLTAQGDDAAVRAMQESLEIEDALTAKRSDEYIAMLKLAQATEDKAAADAKAKQAADDAAQALKDAAAAQERYVASIADLTAQFLNLTGQVDAAAKATLAEQQRQQTNAAVAAGAKPDELALIGVVQLFQRGQLEAQQQIKAQTDTLNAQLKTAQSALSVAQSQLQASQQAASSLHTFKDSITTGPLSGLSPLDAVNAARAERDRLYTAAQGGDTGAAGQYGAAATSLLQLSQGYSASGDGYQADLAVTKSQADALSAQYDHQVSLAQQTVDALNAQIALMQDEIAKLSDANAIASATKAAVISELQKARDAALAPNGALIDQFNALRDTLTGVGRDIVTGERDILVGNQNDVTRATQAEIDAINAGASAQTIATLDAVRLLEIQKTLTDQGFANQVAALGQAFGFDSPQVKAIVALQAEYDRKMKDQIDATKGVGGDVASALSHLPVPTSPPPDAGHPTSPPPVGFPTQPTQPSTPPDYTTGFDLWDPYLATTFRLANSTTQFTDARGNWWTLDTNWHPFTGQDAPGYAAGGDFSGGLRLVGERGPELEATGASRITSTQRLLSALANGGNSAEIVTELRALRDDVQAVVRVGQAGTAATIARLATLADKADENSHTLKRGLERIGVAK